MDEFQFNDTCVVCESEFSITVYVEDEMPIFCPMCGSDLTKD